MNHPPHFVFDFETDTSTGVHIPNHVEYTNIKVDKTHNYDKTVVEKGCFNGYGCRLEFFNWLFTSELQAAQL